MSSDRASRIYPVPSLSPPSTDQPGEAQPGHSITLRQQGNLVTIEPNGEAGQQVLLRRLEQLVQQLEAHGQEVDLRLETLEPISQAVTELAVDLDMRNGRLQDTAQYLASRSDEIEAAHRVLAQQGDQLAGLIEALRTENQQFASQLDQLSDRLGKNRQQHDLELEQLRRRTEKLVGTDRHLEQKINAERGRLEQLSPRVDTLEQHDSELRNEIRSLGEETGTLRRFGRRLAWSLAGIATVGAIALGTLGFHAVEQGQQVETALGALGIEQRRITALQGITDSLAEEMRAIPAHLDNLYRVLTERDVGLQDDIEALGDDLATVTQRLAIPDQPLANGTYDLAKVPGNNWAMAQQPNRYTVQVAALYGKNALANFIGRHRQQLDLDQIAYLQTTYRGRDWYILMQGSYASVNQAYDAAESLPERLQNNGPYVRSFKSVQAQLQTTGLE